jgi:hypothetical protein
LCANNKFRIDMEKTCFVIMPISNSDNYDEGHFKRVYEYIIKPACLKAGFAPIRSDEILNTNDIALDIIKRIINSEMAICDLSSRNPNVFYELGIRQAFDLPVTLIRDSQTERVFDIQGFRDIEYDCNLRIDNVEIVINVISETLKNTYNTKGREINSLISLLGVKSARVTNNLEISKETELILSSLAGLEARLTQIENSSQIQRTTTATVFMDTKGDFWKELSLSEIKNLTVGDIVEHLKFGRGRVTNRIEISGNPIATILFESNEEKKLMLNYVKNLKKLVKGD